MDERKISRVRNLPLAALGLPPKKIRPILERLGGTDMGVATRFSVGDTLAAIEAQKGFSVYGVSGRGCRLSCFLRCLVEGEGLTYFDWHYLPPETATPLLMAHTKEQIRACDARVLNTFSSTVLCHVAREFGRIIYSGKVIPPDEIPVGLLLQSRQFPLVAKRTEPCSRCLSATRDKLRALGFTKRDGTLLDV